VRDGGETGMDVRGEREEVEMNESQVNHVMPLREKNRREAGVVGSRSMRSDYLISITIRDCLAFEGVCALSHLSGAFAHY
jgi:hypothetical protein